MTKLVYNAINDTIKRGNFAGWQRRNFEMGRLGFPELLILLAIIFFLFGAKRLPEVGKGIGEGIRNFKNAMNKEG